MRKIALPTLVLAGLAYAAYGQDYFNLENMPTKFLLSLEQGVGSNTTGANATYDVEYRYSDELASGFFIGSANSSIRLRPTLSYDFTAIAAKNCTACS
jgi:hypothetical protein